MKIKNIIFDLGGVLIDWNPLYVYNKLIPDKEKRDYFFNNICTHDWNIQQDAGTPFVEATRMKVAEFPEWKEYIEAFYGRWEEMLGEQIDGTVKILKSCIDDENLHVYALTNWSAETFPITLDKFDFLHWFEGIVVSGVEKMIKPNQEIYDLILNRYGLVAEESIFIDDNLDNVNAANELGINAIHYKNPEDLLKALSRRGVN